MKASIALAIAILIIGLVPGLFQRQRLSQLREEHRRLVTEAAPYGLSDPDPTEIRQTKRHRLEIDRQSDAIANEMVLFSMDMERVRNSHSENDQAMHERVMEMMSRLASMDAARLRQVIAALEDKPGCSDDAKRTFIGFALLDLAESHPEDAIELFIESSGIFEESAIGNKIITSALSRWAEASPESALSWLRANPEIAGEEAKRALISGTAVNNPAVAFQLMDELYTGDKSAAVQAILASGYEEPEKRDLVLAELRKHLVSIQDEEERNKLSGEAFESFARNLSSGGFDASTAWMAEAGFSAEEKEKFSAGLSYFSAKQETGRWLDWLSTNLAAENVVGPVSTLVSEWTQEDYQSAGKWLHSAQDGPAKITAVQAYATVVAEYEPMVAAQWAMTLPAGPARNSTLQSIYQNWPASDPDGATAFARAHGLE